MAGVLLAVWGLGSGLGGFYYGTRRPQARPSTQFAWLLAGVAASMAVLAVMPTPVALGIALAVGGATIAPALTVENAIVGRIVRAGLLNEAYTWVVTISVAAWAFLFAGGVIGAVALVAAWPSGPIGRADARATARMAELAEVTA